mmetsp:Transcript_144957/g.252822  ORF Transcript_144957/g.252822 Transcript_144957/m.252822 type:complete len:140 (-) Transcript_144957:737-1156(-)
MQTMQRSLSTLEIQVSSQSDTISRLIADAEGHKAKVVEVVLSTLQELRGLQDLQRAYDVERGRNLQLTELLQHERKRNLVLELSSQSPGGKDQAMADLLQETEVLRQKLAVLEAKEAPSLRQGFSERLQQLETSLAECL